MVVYLDSSALTKLVIREPETSALEAWLQSRQAPQATSLLGLTELVRAVRRADAERVGNAYELAQSLHLLGVPASAFRLAAQLDPLELRSLDAIHLATAQQLAGEMTAFVSYDHRLADAATRLGLPVAAPA